MNFIQKNKLNRKSILNEFIQNGMQLRPESLNLLEQFIQNHENQQHQLQKLIEIIKNIFNQNTKLDSSFIEEFVTQNAIQILEMDKNNNININQFINIQKQLGQIDEEEQQQGNQIQNILNNKFKRSIVILDNNKDVPQIYYNNKGECKIKINTNISFKDKIIGEGKSKVELYEDRLRNIKESMKRQKIYIFKDEEETTIDTTTLNEEIFVIKNIGSLLGCNGQCITFGIICEIDFKKYILEDGLQRVHLNLTECGESKGYIVAGHVVLIEGEHIDGTIMVQQIYLPNYQVKSTLDVDSFGAQSKTNQVFHQILSFNHDKDITNHSHLKLLNIYDINNNLYFNSVPSQQLGIIVMQGLHLDSTSNLNNFSKLLQISQQHNLYNLVFILIGDFFPPNSKDYISQQEQQEMEKNMDRFVNIIINEQNESLSNAYWIFVPAVKDIGINVLPRKGLPQFLFQRIEDKLKYVINAQNPQRMTVLGHEIIVSQNESYKYLRKSSIVKVDSSLKKNQLYINTILSQQHLCPIELYSQPIFWKLDYVLHVPKIPNFLILSDPFCPKFQEMLSTDNFVMNPGNFGKNSEFIIIYPNSNNCKVILNELPE